MMESTFCCFFQALVTYIKIFTFFSILDTADECTIFQMMEPDTHFINDVSCGIILSPQFPGLVPPGLWVWVFTPPTGLRTYYSVYVYYVRGPGVTDDDCDQYFKCNLIFESQCFSL